MVLQCLIKYILTFCAIIAKKHFEIDALSCHQLCNLLMLAYTTLWLQQTLVSILVLICVTTGG
jgi:hypothetical protein